MYTIILNQGHVIRDIDQKIISPCDSVDDIDFIEYQNWINQGNNPKEITSIDADIDDYGTVEEISARQARLALLQVGLLDTVESMMSSENPTMKIEWEYATIIQRTNPLVLNFGKMLNLTNQQINELFSLASTF